jgi:hypothetical protein
MAKKKVSDTENWHRFWSVQLAVGIAALNGAVAILPSFIGATKPLTLLAVSCGANVVLALLVIVARVTKQPGL